MISAVYIHIHVMKISVFSHLNSFLSFFPSVGTTSTDYVSHFILKFEKFHTNESEQRIKPEEY